MDQSMDDISHTDWLDLNGDPKDGCEASCQPRSPGCCPVASSLGLVNKGQCRGRLCVPVGMFFSIKPSTSINSMIYLLDAEKIQVGVRMCRNRACMPSV